MDHPFLQAYDTHKERIYRYHFARTRHRETAEDLTSHTFLKAYEHFSRFNASKGSVTTWLYRIARNTLIDHLRRLRPSQQVDEIAELLPSGEDVTAGVVAREAVEQANALLAKLTEEQRQIVLLRLWDDLSYAEIAAVIGKSEGACKMAFRRALDAARTHVGITALLFLSILIPSS
jgi:RNA polymerase sigma-70 factor, ECF subfamily